MRRPFGDSKDRGQTPAPAPAGATGICGDGAGGREPAAEMVSLHRPHSFEAEQFKLLRTRLLFPREGRPPRTIMVTSALPGEGKSFVSTNLAASIAQNVNEYVLLIDCDMRHPSVHRCFGLPDDVPGLSAYLANGGCPLGDLLQRTCIEKLTLLPGGRPPPNPSELLSSRRMSRLLEEVRTRYEDRYVIVDSPPPKMIAEANALARQVDGILLVVRYGMTSRRSLQELVDSLGREKIVGTVLNRLDMRMGRFHSDYYTYRNYKKYYV